MPPQSPTSPLGVKRRRTLGSSTTMGLRTLPSPPRRHYQLRTMPFPSAHAARHAPEPVHRDSGSRLDEPFMQRPWGRGTPWDVARRLPANEEEGDRTFEPRLLMKRSSSDMEDDPSPTESPARLPTIDALRGMPRCHAAAVVSTDRRSPSAAIRNHSREGSSSSPAPPIHGAPSRNAQQLTRDGNATLATHNARSPSATAAAVAPEPAQADPAKKRQRYLRDVDRRSIIRRIENGEKQAALAREFGVTRAAICHIKKNRDEIVSRYDMLLKSAKEMEQAGIPMSSSVEDEPPAVQQLTRPSVLLLLTTLRDEMTSNRDFRLAANRIMMILVEEALAGVATQPCELRTAQGRTVSGVRQDPSLCCVAVGEKGLPLVKLYHQIEPTRAVGCIHLRTEHARGRTVPVVDQLEFPRKLSPDSSILLFSCVSSTGSSICAAINMLMEIGVAEERIRVVVVAITRTAVDLICGQFPRVRVLACVVEETAKGCAPSTTTLGNFLGRYAAVKQEQPREASPVSRAQVDHRRPRVHDDRRYSAPQWTTARPQSYGVHGRRSEPY